MRFGNSLPPSELYDIDVRALADLWEKERISPANPHALKHSELKEHVLDAVSRYPDVLRFETAGQSSEGREIYLVSIGTGSKRILIWSQMHGNEPTAPCSLIDLFRFFDLHKTDAWVSEILRKFTLLCVPMLNPDGAEHGQRRNAQGIDINRDARLLQSPEGRILKSIRDRFNPFLGFNLHDQNSLTTVGNTGKVATIALLAVAANLPHSNEASTSIASDTDIRILTKRIIAVLYEALSPFADGHISRYDELFNPRAFGDNLTMWGTPVVLIESGGTPANQPPGLTVKLNYVGLLAALNSLASDKIQNANPAVFDSLTLNSESPIFDLMLRNAWIFTGTGIAPFVGDVAIRRDQRAGLTGDSIIADLGDLGVYSAHHTIDCSGALVTPGLIGWDPGRSFLSTRPDDAAYLRLGFSTLIETVTYDELFCHRPKRSGELPSRGLNWGFLVLGGPSGKHAHKPLRVAEWLAEGSRGWILDAGARVTEEEKRIPAWFGVDLIPWAMAVEYQIPPSLEGEPHIVLPRWTSRAARQFHIPKRGTIEPGAIADLVIWRSSSGRAPTELKDLRPAAVIINGLPDSNSCGRFIGR